MFECFSYDVDICLSYASINNVLSIALLANITHVTFALVTSSIYNIKPKVTFVLVILNLKVK